MKQLIRRAQALLAALLCLAPAGAPAQQTTAAAKVDAWADVPHGEAVDGLQSRLEIGSNTENITATQSLLMLQLTVRNVSARPILMDLYQATYDFEYEIDGTWYAYEPRTPVRTTYDLSLAASPRLGASIHTIPAGSSNLTFLVAPLADLAPTLRLQPIARSGSAQYFKPTPGAHIIRVRPGNALLDGRQAPISNAVTLTFRMPVRSTAGEQSVSFTLPRNSKLRELQFAAGLADGQALVRDVLARPPDPQNAPRLFSTPVLASPGPLAYYLWTLPRQGKAADPPLPTQPGRYYYPLYAADQVIGYIAMQATPSGAAFVGMNALDHYHGLSEEFRTLQGLEQLAALPQLRGRNYEPRLVQVDGTPGASTLFVFWLHASSGQRDLLFLPGNPELRGWPKLQSGKLYTTGEFLQAARALPLQPVHDEKWAIAAATVCADDQAENYEAFRVFYPEKARVEIELSREQDRVMWYVVIPGPKPSGIIDQDLGREWLVDDADGSCRGAGRAFD